MTAGDRLIRKLSITIVVVMILSIGYYMALRWEPQKKGNIEATVEGVYVINENTADIVSVHIKNMESEYDIVCRENTYSIPKLDGVEISKTKMYQTLFQLSHLLAMRKVTDDLENVSIYGLDEVTSECTLFRENGTSVTVLLGDMVPTGDGYYCMTKDGKSIYVISIEAGKCFTNSMDVYRISTITAIESVDTISSFVVHRNNETILKLREVDIKEQSSGFTTGKWYMEIPYKEYVAEDNIIPFLNNFLNINATGFADDTKEIAYDYCLEIVTGKENYVLCLGKVYGEETIYLKDKQTSSIYTVEKEVWKILEEMNPNDYILKMVHVVNIKDISEVTISSQDSEVIMKPGDEYGKEYFVNSAEVSEEKFKQYYQQIVGITFKEHCEDVPQGDVYMKIAYKYEDGRKEVVIYYEYDDSYYLAVREDGAVLKVLKEEIRKIQVILEK